MNINEFINIFNDSELVDNKIVIKSKLYEAVEFVKNNYSYDILKEIIAIDNKDLGIELIYHLYTTVDEEDLFLSITAKNEIVSIVDLFPSAQADENEIYDLFGINFIGNKNLKRLYMPEDWEGFPLRKDYVQNETRLAWNDSDNV